MEYITTVKELTASASQRGLMHDDLVNLRRVQLMADEITNQKENDGYVCSTCYRRFKDKKHLLWHNRTVHTDTKDYQYSVCFAHFNRADSLRRHARIHQRKREHDQDDSNFSPVKQSKTNQDIRSCESVDANSTMTRKRQHDPNENDIPPAKQSHHSALRKSATNATIGKCIWCAQNNALLPNKFSASCGDQGRECKWCRRPLPERFYSVRTDVCDRCITRRQNVLSRQQHGGVKVNALEETAQTETLQPNTGNLWDILQYFVDNNEQIETILTERLLHVKGMKWFMTLFVKFVKYNQNNEAIYAEPTFKSLSLDCTNVSQIKE